MHVQVAESAEGARQNVREGVRTMGANIRPYALAKEEGSALWFLGTLTFVKATRDQTRGAFALIEQVIPVGFASPYHLHRAEDESFYVVEGQVSFVCDNRWLKVGPGVFVFGPRDFPHGFRVEGTTPARLLILATPGGFERFVVEMSEPAKELTLPPPAPPDMSKLMTLANKYRIEILGPLPA